LIKKAKALAAQLNGIERKSMYIAPEILTYAKDNGLVVVFVDNDHDVEILGAISGVQWNCSYHYYDDMRFYLNDYELLETPDKCDKNDCMCFHKTIKNYKEFVVKMDDSEVWRFENNVPHASFEVLDGEKLYCVGIVFHVSKLRVVCQE